MPALFLPSSKWAKSLGEGVMSALFSPSPELGIKSQGMGSALAIGGPHLLSLAHTWERGLGVMA